LNRHLHIISSNCPYPPDHGKSIDQFQKIIALHEQGIKIHLHYLKCNVREDVSEVNNYCESIHPYENVKAMNEGLKKTFIRDDYPVLIEGNLCKQVLEPIDTSRRKVLVRLHHDEIDCCRKNVNKPGFFQGLFSLNAKKNNNPPPAFPGDYLYVCTSEGDAETLSKQYDLPKVTSLPAFIAWQEIISKEGSGNFCLYHGNLSAPGNERTAIWLLEKVFSEIRFPFVIAGKDPSRRIHTLARLYSHACIIPNPSQNQIDDLVQKAHINIVPSLETSCGRYKLLHSLFSGRHCITNDRMISNTGLEKTCHIANDSRSKVEAIDYLVDKPFEENEIELRKELLLSRYNNLKNSCSLVDWLY
jgi:hypothetical protein